MMYSAIVLGLASAPKSKSTNATTKLRASALSVAVKLYAVAEDTGQDGTWHGLVMGDSAKENDSIQFDSIHCSVRTPIDSPY